jgi:uncharacterized cupredoxin-like copper-binding protein
MNRRVCTSLLFAALPLALPAFAHSGDASSHSAHGKATATTASTPTPFGRSGDPAKVGRTIDVAMEDTMRFVPSRLVVKRGETVRFVVANRGQMLHELVLGTPEALRKHAEEMRKSPNMAHHADSGAVHVQPGAKGELVWTFDKPGAFAYACLVPGHMEAGMVGAVEVK